MKYLYFILTIALSFFSVFIKGGEGKAEAASITTQGPSQVAVGEQFNLRYVVKTTDVSGFRLGGVPDAFEVLMGPITSTQQSFSIVQGKTTQTESVTYTYVLMANKNGTFVIPAAHARVNGKPATSQAIRTLPFPLQNILR